MTNALRNFRIIALLEGISFLILLFVAMPMKYMAGKPLAVKYVGWAHGVLFVLYVLLGLRAAKAEGWTFKFCVEAFVASLIPFGTFILDRKLRAPSNSEA